MDPTVMIATLLLRQEELTDQLPEPARTEYRLHASALRLARLAAHLGWQPMPALERYVKKLTEES